jgi:hypothetical protein
MPEPLSAFQGNLLYLDAMILVGYVDGDSPWHTAARQVFRRRLPPERSVRLVTASLTVDEAVYILLEESLLRPPHNVARNRGSYLRRHPEVVAQIMTALEVPIEEMLRLVTLESVKPEDISAMSQEMLAAGLLPRDAIHVAVMRRLGITAIASDDDDFERCQGIHVFKP